MSGKITVKDVLDFLDNRDESDVDMLSESDDDSDLTLPGGNTPRDGELDIDDELSNSSDSDSSDDLPLATFQRKSLTTPTSYSWQSVPFIAPDDVQFHGNTDVH